MTTSDFITWLAQEVGQAAADIGAAAAAEICGAAKFAKPVAEFAKPVAEGAEKQTGRTAEASPAVGNAAGIVHGVRARAACRRRMASCSSAAAFSAAA